MADIISRVDALNKSLYRSDDKYGTVVLSDISCMSASLNAVPSKCSIYLDRRLVLGESLEQVKREMDALISGKNATWEIGTLHHTSWTGKSIEYHPMHDPWIIEKEHELTQALSKAYQMIYHHTPNSFDFWDFSTNAVIPVSLGIPTIGFGPGEYKLAHMRDERCAIQEIEDAYQVYIQLIKEL
jgi:acetylornithine deacetylase/succinyl-diaminopimelate desuccinylase-like protein